MDTSGSGRDAFFEHGGIAIELCAEIELASESNLSGFTRHVIRSLKTPLAAPGRINLDERSGGIIEFPFEFKCVDAPWESFDGTCIALRYLLRFAVANPSSSFNRLLFAGSPSLMSSSAGCAHSAEKQLWIVSSVDSDRKVPPAGSPRASCLELEKGLEPIRMEVGMDDSLQIRFEYSKRQFDLPDDIITGWIAFDLVRIRVKSCELAIVRKEFISTAIIGRNSGEEDGDLDEREMHSEVLGRWEVIEGDVHKGTPLMPFLLIGEVVPVRIFLNACPDAGPTMNVVAQLFSIRYFLNLVVIDWDNRRYFKQQEVILTRKEAWDPKTDPVIPLIPALLTVQ